MTQAPVGNIRIVINMGLTSNDDLDPYYLNQRRTSMLVGADPHARALRAASSLGELGNEKQKALVTFSIYKDLLKSWLLEAEPPTFESLVLRGALAPGTCFTVLGTFFCSGLRGVRESRPNPLIHRKFVGIAPDGSDLKLTFRMHAEHLMPGSPGDLLSGTVSDLFIVGVVNESIVGSVTCSPVFVGRILVGPKNFPSYSRTTSCELPPEAVDSFAKLGSQPKPRHEDLDLLRTVAEEDVKRAFANVVGEERIPKDWGGERSDLFTTEVVLEGARIPTAFVFKGPAQFKEMTLAQLGKNGDQLHRLATEPADLLVVQHCHLVAPQVRVLMRAICNQVGSSRRFTIIDGLDTLRFLQAYRQCGFTPRGRRRRRA